MFSQFRQAVENLAQPLPRQSQDNAFPADFRSRSPDSQRQSSPQLAENTLVNLRKIAAQRAASPVQQNTGNPRPRSASPGPSSTVKSTSDSGLRKTTLEERLRASFAVSESSGGSTPSSSTSVLPSTIPVTQRPLSPTSTPIPDSPTLAVDTTVSALETPVGGSVQDEEYKETNGALAPPQEPNNVAQLPSATPPVDPQDPVSLTVGSTDTTSMDSTDPCVGVTLTQEAPQATHTEPEPHLQQDTQVSEVVDALTADTAPPGEESVEAEPEPTKLDRSKDADVEALQERLKLVEQRFAGKVAYIAHLG